MSERPERPYGVPGSAPAAPGAPQSGRTQRRDADPHPGRRDRLDRRRRAPALDRRRDRLPRRCDVGCGAAPRRRQGVAARRGPRGGLRAVRPTLRGSRRRFVESGGARRRVRRSRMGTLREPDLPGELRDPARHGAGVAQRTHGSHPRRDAGRHRRSVDTHLLGCVVASRATSRPRALPRCRPLGPGDERDASGARPARPPRRRDRTAEGHPRARAHRSRLGPPILRPSTREGCRARHRPVALARRASATRPRHRAPRALRRRDAP